MATAEPMPAWRRLLGLGVLIVAGEAVFGLPFHVARFFRPTLLAGLGISNAQLGGLFAAYGVVAALCYLPGGLLADRFSARRLMCAGLVLTGIGGLGLTTLPDTRVSLVIYAGFGVTTILLFWAALIRATRAWGGAAGQGAAFGALEAGRGLFAAGLASLAWLPFRAAFGDVAAATDDQRLLALRGVFLVYTATTFAAAALVWLVVPAEREPADARERPGLRALGRVLASPVFWAQAAIVFAAYCAYKGIDNYALYLMHAYAMDEVEASRATVVAAWLRPVAALAAGLLADRSSPTRVAALCFAGLVAAYGALAFSAPRPALVWLDLAVTCLAAFGLRGVYFAVLEQARVPSAMTGTTVGLISMIGFTPEIFIAPLTGWLLDRSPGLAGHHDVFVLLAALSALGLLASVLLARRLTR